MTLVGHYDLRFRSNGCESCLPIEDLEVEVYKDQPMGFIKKRKSIYGHKQAS